jgi:phosphoribosylformylglycinamidine synthase subunit PurSL
MIQTIRVFTYEERDIIGDGVLSGIKSHIGENGIRKIRTAKVYRIEGVSVREARVLAEKAFAENVNQGYTLNAEALEGARQTIEIAYKPGVMNPEAASLLKAASDLGITPTACSSSMEYGFFGKLRKNEAMEIASQIKLFNPTVEYIVSDAPKTLVISGSIGKTTLIPIRKMGQEELMDLSKKNLLFLNEDEMKAIQKYFINEGRDATDCEVEVFAQTWSEHCVHKTFKSPLIIDGERKKPLFKRIKETAVGHDDLIVSAFVDNSGVIDFYDGYGICAKVETHNSPSAIEPYGGAMTGSGGVFRDVLGTGQGARILAASDIFCFAPPNLPLRQIPPGCLPPDYLLQKVVAGVRDYGNRVGVPTTNGSIHFHPDFRAKPTVAVGAFGILKKDKAVKRTPKKDDLILTLGGRTGRDGIHGATFSSASMSDTTVTTSGTAVQIGNAIEEKRVIDAVLKLSDTKLIRAITDCGAGGYSSAIGEMGKDTGARVYLERVPLKYANLAPWEIFLSESQERMVIAIDPSDLKEVMRICGLYNVEATVIGEFTDTQLLEVFYKDEAVCELSMDFLHNGVPIKPLVGTLRPVLKTQRLPAKPKDLTAILKKVLSHPNVCSKEPIVRMYDHNVQGTTALHPFSGVEMDGPQDGSIVKPLLTKPYGMAISHGLHPALMRLDPYWGSVWAITEAVSNFVALGGSTEDAALIDNFIFPTPDPFTIADLDRTVDACYHMSRLLMMPFVSGKDSLSSTYNYPDGKTLMIPPVLLISVFGRIRDVAHTVSSDFKKTGSTIVLVGNPDFLSMGGSAYFDVRKHKGSANVPKVDLQTLPAVFSKIHKGIQMKAILSAHDVSDGGIGVAISEMCFGGGMGAEVDISKLGIIRADFALFNETAGTFVVEVENESVAKKLFSNIPYTILGKTQKECDLVVYNGKRIVLESSVSSLKRAWKKPMEEYF